MFIVSFASFPFAQPATGADTIAGSIVLLLYFLIANPKWIPLLRKELGIFRDQAPSQWLRSLDQLIILNAFIQESLRLGSPFQGFPRVAPKDGAVIDGHYVPGGTTVNVPGWAYHLDEGLFPNPTVFDPERWFEKGNFSAAKATLLTFSSGAFRIPLLHSYIKHHFLGPFGCVGQKLALLQFRILLAMLVVQLDITPAPGFNADKFWNGVRNRRATTFREPLWVNVRNLSNKIM